MITVYGASDDLIEVDGDISEEFPTSADFDKTPSDLLAFSDGTILRVEYTTAGVWRITPVVRGSADLTIVHAPEGDDSNYTDRATLGGDVRWVVHGIDHAAAKRGADA